MNEQRMQTRTTTVRGQSITVYSADGQRWFSNLHEARQCEKRRQEFLAERSRSLKSDQQHSSTPVIGDTWQHGANLEVRHLIPAKEPTTGYS